MWLKKIFQYENLVLIFALALSTVGAYFSVYGIGLLFASNFAAASVLGIVLEACKVSTAGLLGLRWGKIQKTWRMFLALSVIGLSIYTSVGIYSFLSSSFQENNNKIEFIDKQKELYDSKKKTFQVSISQLEKEVKLKNDRIITLNNIRINQETALNSENNNVQYMAYQNIKNSDKQIVTLQKQVDTINKKILVLNDSVSKYDIKSIDLDKGETMNNDVGTFKYLSKLTGIDMNTLINWIILFILLFCDPLAIILILAISNMTRKKTEGKETVIEEKERASDESYVEKEISTEKSPENIQEYVADKTGNFILKDKLEKIHERFSDVLKEEEKTENKEEASEDVFREGTIAENAYEGIDNFEEEEQAQEEVVEEKHQEQIQEDVVEEKPQEQIQEDVVEEKPQEQAQEEVIDEKPQEQAQEEANEESDWNVISNPIQVETNDPAEAHTILTTPEEPKPEIKEERSLNSLYLQFLDVMLENGNSTIGQRIMPFRSLQSLLNARGISYNEKELSDFLVICNLLKITEMVDGEAYVKKDFETSYELIKNI